MIDLPVISPLAAEAATRLAPRLPAMLDFDGQRLCAGLAGRREPAAPASWLAFQARIGVGRALLRLDPELLPASVVELWPEIQAVGVPDDLAKILRGMLLVELVELVHRLSGERPDWEAADEAPFEPAQAVLLSRDTPDGPRVAQVALDDAALAWLAARMEGCAPLRAELDALPTSLSLNLDGIALSAAELAGLEVGDVVLLDIDPFLESGGLSVALVQPGGPRWRAALEADSLSILSTLDGMMNDPEALEPDAIDDLPMEIACEVGRITLPLFALREIAEGQVMDLGPDATSTVSLRVNGQVVATGELVRIAERVGIRLTDVKAPRR